MRSRAGRTYSRDAKASARRGRIKSRGFCFHRLPDAIRGCLPPRKATDSEANPMFAPPLAYLPSPLGIVGLAIVFIVVAIAVLRLHAFFALILAATFVSL